MQRIKDDNKYEISSGPSMAAIPVHWALNICFLLIITDTKECEIMFVFAKYYPHLFFLFAFHISQDQGRKWTSILRPDFLLVDLRFFFRFRVGGLVWRGGGGLAEMKKKKSSKNDQLTGHFQRVFFFFHFQSFFFNLQNKLVK